MKTVISFATRTSTFPPGPEQLLLNEAEGKAQASPAWLGPPGYGRPHQHRPADKRTAHRWPVALGLQAKPVPTSLLQFVTSAADGSVILVVGHSTTVPQMIAALGTPFPGPPMQAFDDLFVVTVVGPNQAAVVRLKYGAGTDTPSIASIASALPVGPTLIDHAGVTSHGLAVEFSGELFGGKEKLLKAVSGGDAIGDHLVLVSDRSKNPTVARVLKARVRVRRRR